MRVLFIGDIVGPRALKFVVKNLPKWKRAHRADAVVVNGENMAVSARVPTIGFGMWPSQVEALIDCGVDVITSGNHAWDGDMASEALAYPQVLRPLNVPPQMCGKGIVTVTKGTEALTVINLASKSAIPSASSPLEAFRRIGQVDGFCLVDFHGDLVNEKMTFAFAVDGVAHAVIGTHTHEASLPIHVLPKGTALVTEVGMAGPLGGVQGIEPDYHLRWMSGMEDTDLPPFRVASGELTIGAVLCEFRGGAPSKMSRVLA